jgi:hypothetical protein
MNVRYRYPLLSNPTLTNDPCDPALPLPMRWVKGDVDNVTGRILKVKKAGIDNVAALCIGN